MTAPFDREYPATVGSLADARHELRVWLRDQIIDDVALHDLLTVAGEFFLHVVVRTGGAHGRARLVAERGPDGVRLAVTAVADETTTLRDDATVRALRLPHDPLDAGSIGRRLVDGFCDSLEIDDGSAVGARCWRTLQSTS
jgi:hypothetical protein